MHRQLTPVGSLAIGDRKIGSAAWAVPPPPIGIELFYCPSHAGGHDHVAKVSESTTIQFVHLIALYS